MIFYKFLSLWLYVSCTIIFTLSACILITAGLLHLPLFYMIDKIFCRLILLSLGIWPKINGKFPNNGPYIIMMNHSSFIDVFIFPLIPKGPYTGITAIENFKYPIFSTLIRRIKAIPIERKNITSAIDSIKQAELVLNQGIHIGILPEGTRTKNGKLLNLKKGGFHMAINTNTAVVPVGISGAFKYKPKDRWWLNPCSISVNIGAATDINDYNDLGVNGLLFNVEKKLKILSGETNEA